MEAQWSAACVLLLLLLCRLLWQFVDRFWWKPKVIEAKLRSQGISGPRPKFMVGNLLEIIGMRQGNRARDIAPINHDILEQVLPDQHLWSRKYGKNYVYWWLTEPRVILSDPEMIREVLSKKAAMFEKSLLMQAGLLDLVGAGLVTLNGVKWSHHRKVVTPAFHLEKLKGMVGVIAECFTQLADKWEAAIQVHPELEISEDLSMVTADVISHTAFGSNYLKGKRVFEILTAVPQLLSKLDRYQWVPGVRRLPISCNREANRLQQELRSLLLGMVNERRNSVKFGRSESHGNDLLGLIISESEEDKSSFFDDQSLVDECKTFYLAGQETTATLLTWTLFLLALHQEWQDEARTEVENACNGKLPGDYDIVSKLKLVGMILNETLRLYPPVGVFFRGSVEDTRVGDLIIPKGAAVSFPVMALHHDPQYWGPDANEFNPLRFKDGISNACKHPNAFLPFSFGPRICVGQAFAIIEAKVALAVILRRFRFRLSPNYRHNPTLRITLKPLHGMQLEFEKV